MQSFKRVVYPSCPYFGNHQFSHNVYKHLDTISCVSVERGVIELRKLGLEQQLWETSRKDTEFHSPSSENTNHKQDVESENST